MVIAGDVAINGRASGNSWSLRAYPPWTRRRDALGLDRLPLCSTSSTSLETLSKSLRSPLARDAYGCSGIRAPLYGELPRGSTVNRGCPRIIHPPGRRTNGQFRRLTTTSGWLASDIAGPRSAAIPACRSSHLSETHSPAAPAHAQLIGRDQGAGHLTRLVDGPARPAVRAA
jgi:hypothetical protein